MLSSGKKEPNLEAAGKGGIKIKSKTGNGGQAAVAPGL